MITKSNKSIYFILTLIFLLISFYAKSQNFTKNSIHIGCGPIYSESNHQYGFGLNYSIAYQRELNTGRLRFQTLFSMGHLNSKTTADVGEQSFTSLNIELNVMYDLIKFRAFSVFAGVGGFGNNSFGMKTNYWTDSKPSSSSYPFYFNDLYAGGNILAGFRLNFPDKRIALNFTPFHLRIGTENLIEYQPNLSMDIKL